MKRTCILLADDHAMVCAGLRKLLEPECEVVGTAADSRAPLKAVADLEPYLVLVDAGMPTLNGLDVGRQMQACAPHKTHFPGHEP